MARRSLFYKLINVQIRGRGSSKFVQPFLRFENQNPMQASKAQAGSISATIIHVEVWDIEL